MTDDDKRKYGLIGAASAVGGGLAVIPGVMRHRAGLKKASKKADEIVSHLTKHGIGPEHRVALTGVGGAGKSSISRALYRKGWKVHIPLDGMGDEAAGELARKGIPKGAVMDQAFVLHKTGGGQYDAVVKVNNPGSKEIRRRLVQRGAGAQRLYNRIDYDKFEREVSRPFDALQGHRADVGGAKVVITRAHKQANAAAVPITSSQDAWKKIHRPRNSVKDPIRTSEILRARPELHAIAGAALGGSAAAAGMAVDNRRKTRSFAIPMKTRLDRLIEFNAKASTLVEFAQGDKALAYIAKRGVEMPLAQTKALVGAMRGNTGLYNQGIGEFKGMASKAGFTATPGMTGMSNTRQQVAQQLRAVRNADRGIVPSQQAASTRSVDSSDESWKDKLGSFSKRHGRLAGVGAAGLGVGALGAYGLSGGQQYSARIEKLIQLNTKAAELIEFGDDGGSLLGYGAAGVGGAGVLGGGLYMAGRGRVKKAVKASGLAADEIVGKGAAGIGNTMGVGAGRIGEYLDKAGVAANKGFKRGEGALNSLWRGARGFGKSLIHAKFSARDELDDIIHFDAGTGAAILIGNPLSASINARKGKKWDAFKDAYGNVLADTAIGGTAGAAVGAGVGAIIGGKEKKYSSKYVGEHLIAGGPYGVKYVPGRYKTSVKTVRSRGAGAATGALIAGGLGAIGGSLYGHLGPKAKEIRHRYE